MALASCPDPATGLDVRQITFPARGVVWALLSEYLTLHTGAAAPAWTEGTHTQERPATAHFGTGLGESENHVEAPHPQELVWGGSTANRSYEARWMVPRQLSDSIRCSLFDISPRVTYNLAHTHGGHMCHGRRGYRPSHCHLLS